MWLIEFLWCYFHLCANMIQSKQESNLFTRKFLLRYRKPINKTNQLFNQNSNSAHRMDHWWSTHGVLRCYSRLMQILREFGLKSLKKPWTGAWVLFSSVDFFTSIEQDFLDFSPKNTYDTQFVGIFTALIILQNFHENSISPNYSVGLVGWVGWRKMSRSKNW